MTRLTAIAAGVCLLFASSAAPAATYHVSPRGDDHADGATPATAWRTVAKVSAAQLRPGDTVLFERGGLWRESLKAPSSGAPGKPITFAAYGRGDKPRFHGGDVLDATTFKPGGGSVYTLAMTRHVGAVLEGDAFYVAADDADQVRQTARSWHWADGVLTINTGGPDPRQRGATYTACVRVDPVFSNGKDHLVFRDLVVDESADARDGYGFRVMDSSDVLIEDCEAYRAGRHHFGVINSTGFTGRRLYAAWAMPNIPGGATFYVSFSDARRKGDTHRWIDCRADHLDNPGHGYYQAFYNHGEGLGPILIQNMTTRGGRLSADAREHAPVTIRGGTITDASLELFGSHVHVDGVRITGNGALDCYASDSVLENVLIDIAPDGGGPTGYASGVVMRKDARRNTLRFSTVVMRGGNACIAFAGRGTETRWYGNVLQGPREPIRSFAGPIDKTDAAYTGWNLYGADAVFPDGAAALSVWQQKGFDAHSLAADPRFDAANAQPLTPTDASPAKLPHDAMPPDHIPTYDHLGQTRGTRSITLGAIQHAD
ncbi:MAG: hypothetical protein GC159_24070 [Phycisphaera sp.]|nr:hypothetical protein [Phycisphaera sp.]